MTPPLLFAWFTNPAMLWGLAAASLPILIHLLNRRRFREMPWAAMRFLLAAVRKNQRRVKIEQWLLLALRTLLVVCLVLAMARPVLESLGAAALLPGQRTHWVLAVDGSMSMDHTAAETSRFDHAKELAAQLVRATRQGDGISLVLMAEPPRAVIGAPAFSREAALREVEELTLTHGPLNLPASFKAVDEVLAASDIPRKEVVFLTDLQTASWTRGRSGPDEAMREVLARFAERKVHSSVIDLGSASAENRAVTALTVDPPLVTPAVPATIRATLRHYGRGSPAVLRAQLIVDGQLGPEETVTVAPGESQSVAFSYTFAAPGDHVVEVQIDPDALKVDDRARRVVPVREAVPVLLVDGDPKPAAMASETAFLAPALSPELEATDVTPVTPIKVDVVSEAQWSSRELGGYDAVVFANVARFTPSEVAAMEAFLKEGGGLVFFGGDQVVPENYNTLLFAGGKGLLPAEVGPVAGQAGPDAQPFLFDALGFRHPLLAAFAGELPTVTASLTNVKTLRYHRLRPPRGGPAQVSLGFSSGDPAVVEMPRHRGRVFQVATGADTAWTSWPMHPSYPPVMEQLVLLAASGRAAERNLRVGQPLVQGFPAPAAGAEATVRRPAGPPATVRLVADGEMSRLRYEGTDRSGVYQVELGAPWNLEPRFAANPDPAESDPAKLDAEGLRAALPGWSFVYDNDWRPLRQDAKSVARRGELHRPLLWAVLGLLLLESFVAWKFGHHAGRG